MEYQQRSQVGQVASKRVILRIGNVDFAAGNPTIGKKSLVLVISRIGGYSNTRLAACVDSKKEKKSNKQVTYAVKRYTQPKTCTAPPTKTQNSTGKTLAFAISVEVHELALYQRPPSRHRDRCAPR